MFTRNTVTALTTISCALIIGSGSGCRDTSLAINPDATAGQICDGEFVTGEPFVLCRRVADGALGGFEVFLADLVVDATGDVVLAGKLTVGLAEVTQTFDELDDRERLFWQLKSPDDTLLQLQEIAGLPDVAALVAAGDTDVIDALAFIDGFIEHYLFNDNLDVAQENDRVYGIDDFLQCLGTEPATRDGICYTLYDQAPAGAPDGTLDQEDFKALSRILTGDDTGVGEVEFSIEAFLACKQASFNDNEDENITPSCAAFDTNSSGSINDVDLRNLLLGEIPDNFSPVAVAGDDQAVGGNETVILNARESFDVESSSLLFLWEQIAGVAVSLTEASSVEARFVSPEVSSTTELKFRITVTDESGATDSDQVVITVDGTGDASSVQADAGSNQQVTAGDLVTLDASGSSGSDLSLQWLQVSGTTVTLSANDTERPVFTAPSVASATVLRFQLTASSNGESDTDTVDITVLPSS